MMTSASDSAESNEITPVSENDLPLSSAASSTWVPLSDGRKTLLKILNKFKFTNLSRKEAIDFFNYLIDDKEIPLIVTETNKFDNVDIRKVIEIMLGMSVVRLSKIRDN